MTLQERIARAIAETEVRGASGSASIRLVLQAIARAGGMKWDEAAFQHQMGQLATAVLAILREPTEEMIEAGDVALSWCWNTDEESYAARIWQAMLNAGSVKVGESHLNGNSSEFPSSSLQAGEKA